ncbi:MAG: hypothetical protein V2A62_04830 [Candidatus Woesearchaeota archaeon]
MAKSSLRLFVYALLLTLLLFGLIRMILSVGGNLFNLELFVFIIFLALTLGGLVGYKTLGEEVLFWVFLFYLMNLLGLWFLLGSVSVVLLILALMGLILALPKKRKVKSVPAEEELHSEVFDPGKAVPEAKTSKVKGEKAEVAKEVTFTPGKYVASKSSNVYHEPKCDWAKKIRDGRRIWFESKEEAKKKGYRQHSCVN